MGVKAGKNVSIFFLKTLLLVSNHGCGKKDGGDIFV